MNFLDYYENTEILNEMSLGQLNKGFLRIGKNIFSKRVAGFNVDTLSSLNKIDRSAYNYIQGVLSKNYMDSDKKKDKVYIKKLYKGEIDDAANKLGGYDNIKKAVKDISIYETNKGGRIITFYLDDGDEIFYLGTTWRGDTSFRDIFGTWPNAMTSRLNYRMGMGRTKQRNSSQGNDDEFSINSYDSEEELNYALSNPREFLAGKYDKQSEKQPEISKKEPENININKNSTKNTKVGTIDISDDLRIMMIEDLGTGAISDTKPEFTRLYKRRRYTTDTFEGYEYILKGGVGSFFLLDYNDNSTEAGLIAFSNPDAYKLTKRVGILDYWMSPGKPLSKEPVQWHDENIGIEIK